MSPKLMRALQRLSQPAAKLEPARTGDGFALYPNADRRRRPSVRLCAADARALCAEGVLEAAGDSFVLSHAGRKLLIREHAPGPEMFAAQHREIVDRKVVRDGVVRTVRGHDPDARLKRLTGLRDAAGAPLFSAQELAAAGQLQADWDRADAGLVRGSDWSAAPLGGERGVSNAQERAMAMRCDAHTRLSDTLDQLAPPLRRALESVCRYELGLEALEREEKLPPRSGKWVLKLALAQVAEIMRSHFERSARGKLDAVHHGEKAV